ncbi:MAG: arsenate reductase ArsC, partial [Terriglobales bacterium]
MTAPVPIRVLILCTGNSARSQMAEGLLRAEGGRWFLVASAGTHPTALRSEAVSVMRELGIDISGQKSKSLDVYRGASWDWVITVCDHAALNCPIFPGSACRLHWSFSDPATVKGGEAERLAAFRAIRDQIRG